MKSSRFLAYAGTGILATAAGMATGHLVAAALNPPASPVLAVGSTVIDLTPTPVKEWAIREFGTADKPILIGSVIAVTLLIAGGAGILARRSLPLAGALLLGLVAVAGVMAMLRPVAEAVDVVPAAAAAFTGLAALGFLVRGLRASEVSSPSRRSQSDLLRDRGAEGASPSRRGVVIGAGVIGLATVAFGAAGQWVIRARTSIGNITLPRAAKPIAALPVGLDARYEGISSFRTSNKEFYRVDTALTLPVITLDDWRLTIDGDVDDSFSLTFDELLELPMIERDITMTCVSNDVGGRYVGGARWLGVPLADLLDRAGVRGKADQILSTAVDGFTISTPLEVALDGRDTMVAVGMNGEPLPLAHGFPARLITPGIYGFVGATKWLRRLTLTTYDKDEAYWTERGWATDAPIKVSARIDTPKPLDTIDAGPTFIGGIAWAQRRGIKRVDVRIDGGAWQEAQLGPSAGVDYWRQWFLPWDATKGRHMLAVRAVTADGEVQTAARMSPFPEGASGIQEIVVSVR